MESDSFIIVLGDIPARPEFGTTEDGHPFGEFHVRCRQKWTGRAGQQCDRELHFLVRVVGHELNSLKKYWFPGCSVTIAGVLDQRVAGGRTETYIRCTSLAYSKLSPILKALAS